MNIVKNERESDSDEDIDDLLSEYQSYLEKAHKQTKNYFEKSKLKNKVPLLRHEKFTKNNLPSGKKHDDFLNETPGTYSSPDTFRMQYMKPLDIINFVNKVIGNNHMPQPQIRTADNQDMNTYKKIMLSEENPLIQSSFPKNLKKSCYCKNNKLPCSCGCKQCLIRMDSLSWDSIPKASDDEKKRKLENTINPDNKFTGFADDTLNIKVKVDVELPISIHETLLKNHEKVEFDKGNAREISPVLKIPGYVPISMNTFGYKKITDYDSTPIHKITIHKKKKSKPIAGNKKHRKKMITFHNFKIEPQQLFEAHFGKRNLSLESKTETPNLNTTEVIYSTSEINVDNMTKKIEATNNTETHTEENIFIMVNISSSPVNGTEEYTKTENSVETDYTNATDRSTHILKKREVTQKTTTKAKITTTNKNKTASPITQNAINVKVFKARNRTKRIEKGIPSDEELTYWPKEVKGKVHNGQITALILESENKKAKINVTNEALRNNHKRVLEKAIFGDVDWNNIDLDAVAPAFLSFVGKYITGVLTMCSNRDCHSMKCAREICAYRVCKPTDRINSKGHCTTNTKTNNTGKAIHIFSY